MKQLKICIFLLILLFSPMVLAQDSSGLKIPPSYISYFIFGMLLITTLDLRKERNKVKKRGLFIISLTGILITMILTIQPLKNLITEIGSRFSDKDPFSFGVLAIISAILLGTVLIQKKKQLKLTSS